MPNLEAPESPKVGIGVERHRKYLLEYQKPLYTAMLLGNTPNTHLEKVDRSATEMFDRLIEQLKRRDGIMEDMKVADQLEWVQHMNVIRQEAAEIVTGELICI